MKNQSQVNGLLEPFRVLDIAGAEALVCGKILGDLGADVIKVERPGGDRARNIGPFYHDIPDPQKSLFWFAFNNNKRGITLDIETLDGQCLFRRLVETADFVVESFAPGYMDKLGLGYALLSAINPRIIMASITPFGQSGPYMDYKANDLVAWAMGGQTYLSGDPDRPPVQVTFPQAHVNASAQAAAAVLIAHYRREISGMGQHVDVSIQESVTYTLMNAQQYWDIPKIILKRSGCYRAGHAQGAMMRTVWQCRDGYVNLTILGGTIARLTIMPLVKWMKEQGAADEFLLSVDWANLDTHIVTQEFFDRIEEPVAKFLLLYTKAELYAEAIKRSFILYPVNSAGEVLADRQLAARDFWEHVDHSELGVQIVYPGAFFKSTEANGGIRFRAPLIGEHNLDIYEGELGLTPKQVASMKQANVI